jgi:hypothetical protein
LVSDFFFFFSGEAFTLIVQTSTSGGSASIFGGSLSPKAALPPLYCHVVQRSAGGRICPLKEAANRSPTPGRRSGMQGPTRQLVRRCLGPSWPVLGQVGAGIGSRKLPPFLVFPWRYRGSQPLVQHAPHYSTAAQRSGSARTTSIGPAALPYAMAGGQFLFFTRLFFALEATKETKERGDERKLRNGVCFLCSA